MKEDKGRMGGKVERVANISWREDNGILKKKKSKLIATITVFPYSGFRYVVPFRWFVEKKKRKNRFYSGRHRRGIGYSRWGKPIRKTVVNRLQDKILFAGRKTLFGGG